MRSRKGGYRRLAERLELYGKAIHLHKLGLADYQIARRLLLPRSQIRAWLAEGVKPIYDRYDPDLSPSRDLAYLVGFWMGDGRNAGGQKKVRFKLADRNQLEYVNHLLARLLQRVPKPILNDGPFFVVDYDTSALYDFLDQPLAKLSQSIGVYVADFVRGFFDAEGYVSCHVDEVGRRLSNLQVGAANTSIEYLNLVRRLLAELGMDASIHTTNKIGTSMTIRGKTWLRRHNVMHVAVRGLQVTKMYCSKIGFSNPSKQSKLNDLVSAFELPPEARFDWFIARYKKQGRKWTRITQ